MKIFSYFWNQLDGKKTVLGWLATQIPVLGQPTVLSAWNDEINAVVYAIGTKNYSVLITPTCYALGQTLLAVGVFHGIVKQVQAGKDVVPATSF